MVSSSSASHGSHASGDAADRKSSYGSPGAPPSPTLLAKLKELGFRPVHVYGLTETYGPHTVCAWEGAWDCLPADEMAKKAARQGQGYVVFDLVRVVDEQGRDVAMDGETLGEVIMRGNNVMKGYFEQPDATAEAFRGGWFHSGDIAVWHPDGYIELRDRKKDIIISGGENISTIEVEQAVARHPAVMECAVVAIPDERWGERPKAFVTLKPGMKATDGEIIEFCDRFLPKGLDATALRSLVQKRARALGVTDLKQVGRLIGDVMKSHKGHVDAADVKRIAEDLLKP